MITAYDNGAKYITIFDSNKEFNQGILQPEHLAAMEKFWQYTQNNPRKSVPESERVAFVLPQDYGYGFRGPDDKIWGLSQADDLSTNISIAAGNLLNQYDSKLDIIYEDDVQSGKANGYSRLFYWNDTSLLPSESPDPSVNPAPDSQNETSASPKPSDQNDTITDENGNVTLPTEVLLTAAVCAVVVPVIIIAVVLRKRKRFRS